MRSRSMRLLVAAELPLSALPEFSEGWGFVRSVPAPEVDVIARVVGATPAAGLRDAAAEHVDADSSRCEDQNRRGSTSSSVAVPIARPISKRTTTTNSLV